MPLNWPCSLARFLWTHKNTLASDTRMNQLPVISSINLYDDRTLLVPAVELVLLQRDVGVGIELPLFLHISFSFLWDERIRRSDLQFLTSNSCSVSACWQTHFWLVLCPHVIPSSKRSVDTWASSWGEKIINCFSPFLKQKCWELQWFQLLKRKNLQLFFDI